MKTKINPWILKSTAVFLSCIGLTLFASSGFAQSTANYGFATATTSTFTDMSSGTTSLLGAGVDDTASSPVTNIGFDFYLMGVRYTQFSVNDNGNIRLTSVALGSVLVQSGSPYSMPNGTSPLLNPFGNDLRVGSDGNVISKVTGSAPNRVLTIQATNVMIRFLSSAAAGTATFQTRLYEGTGVVEYVYGTMTTNAASPTTYTVGFSVNTTVNNIVSVDTTANTASTSATVTTNAYLASSTIAQLNAPVEGSRKNYTFTPAVPAAPSGLSFTSVGSGSMTLNFTDNASNELGFVIYRSTDGTNFSFVSQIAAAAGTGTLVSTAQGGLTPSTTYFWQIYAVTEGALSPVLAGSQATGAATTRTSTSVGGLWSAPGTWVGGIVPDSPDDVVIADSATVTIDTAAVCANLTVGQGASGILQYQDTVTARSLTVGSNVTVAASGTFSAFPAATVIGAHTLSLGGNLINNGTMNFNIINGANTSSAQITFTGASDAAWTLGASSSTNLKQTTGVSLNKGTNSTPVLTFTPAGTFTVVGANTLGFLSISNGTFKISGSGTFSNPVFNATGYTISATGGIWLNNANYTIVGQGSSPTNAGLLRLTAGTYNIGTAAGNAMGGAGTSVFIIEGGTMNIASRLLVSSSGASFNMSAGTINVCTVGNTASGSPSFGFTSATSVFTMSGGTINLVQATTTGATLQDYQVSSTVSAATITGGTVNVGTAATAVNFVFRIQGQMPNVVVDNTTNNKTANLSGQTNIWRTLTINSGATLNTNPGTAQALVLIGPSITNNGAIVNTSANTGNVIFAGNLGTSPAQTYSGTGTFGSAAAPIGVIGVQNIGGVTISGGVPTLNTLRINALFGAIAGASNITLGNGGASSEIVQRGVGANSFVAGTLDAAPTFSIGTGGLTLIYAQGTAPTLTSFEVPPSRIIAGIQVANPNGVTIAGGPLTATATAGGLVLSSGTLNTSAANLLTLTGAAAGAVSGGSAVTYVNGPLERVLPASLASGSTFTFPVGKGSFKMLELVNPTTNAGGTVTIQTEVFDVDSGGVAGVGFSAINHNRYWSSAITAGAANFTNTTVRLTEQGTPGANAIGQSATQGGAYDSIGGAVVAPTIGPSAPASTTLGFFVVGTLTGAPTITGPLNVGGGGDFTTLTAAVAAYNSRLQTGPVTFTLTDGAYAGETFPIIINPNGGASAVNTLTIKPLAGMSPTFSGSSTSAMFIINGADWVIFDGNNGGTMRRSLMVPTRDVTITNTNTGTATAVIWLQSISTTDSATNNTIKNLNLVGSGNLQTLVGVGSGSSTISITSTGTGNNNNRFENNSIRATQYGIYSGGASATNRNTGNVFNLNAINTVSPNNVGKGGIFVKFDNGAQITNNTIGNLLFAGSFTSSVHGIALGLSPSNTTVAFTGSDVTNATVTGNTISGAAHTGTGSAFGIVVNSVAYGTTLVANNMISGVDANTSTPSDFAGGIVAGGGTGSTTQIYYNSVSMTGSRTGATSPSYALAIGAGDPIVNVTNNILYNTQSSTGSGKSYAIATGGTTFVNLTSNFNDFFVSGANAFVGQTGPLGTTGTDRATLANWQTATGRDTPNSVSGDPLFTSATTNLHLSAFTSPAANAGTPIGGITVDIDGDSRSPTRPDMGADEIISAELVSLVLSAGTPLTPPFASGTLTYTLNVAHNVTSTTVTPTVVDSNSTITVNATSVASGGTSAPIALAVGNTVITTVVTPQFGPTKTYTVTVTRAPLPQVSTGSDSGPGSLRQILADAVDGDTITFGTFRPGNGKTIEQINSVVTITSGELVIAKNITIDGGAANVTTVMRAAGPAFRIFHVLPGHTVTISGLTISNGLATGSSPADFGGGIYNSHSNLTVTNCEINGNNAAFGAGIFNNGSLAFTGPEEAPQGVPLGSLTVIGSTLDSNTASGGGGIYNFGDSPGADAELTVNNSTFSANAATGGIGGAIVNDGASGGFATARIANSTFSRNTAPTGGGAIYNNEAATTIGNTIFKKGATGGPNLTLSGGSFASAGYNLSDDAAGGSTTTTVPGGLLSATGDQRNTDPMLGLLQNNGGTVPTHAPLVNSPAIDKGKRDAILALTTNFDQRGLSRPVDDPAVANAASGDFSDIGAIELRIPAHPSDAASSKQHGPGGPVYEIPLGLMTALPGVECRSGGAAGDYQVIIRFAGTVTFSSPAIVTNGTGSVFSNPGSGTSTITVNLTGVTNAQTVTVALPNVNDSVNAIADVGVRMGVLLGDTDGNRLTNSTDVSSVQFQSGQILTGPPTGNYRNDLTANGAINSSDVSTAETQSGTGLLLP